MSIQNVVGFSLSLSVASVGIAQTDDTPAPEDTGLSAGLGIEEVIVTTRKRTERLQDAPLSVTAFTAEQIEQAGIEDLQDVAHLTPGLTFTSLFGSLNAAPVIRGVSTNIGEPNVGIFLDGVYQSSRATTDALLGSIERIEIAKGPQSALYGRNTFGGAINYITKRPADTLQGQVELTLGEDARTQLRGSVSGPLSNTWYYRVGASRSSFDGYFNNELNGDGLDDKETTLFAASLEARPTDTLEVVFRTGYETTNNGDYPLQFVPNNDVFVPSLNGNQAFSGELPNFESGFAVTPGMFEREQLNASLRIAKDFGNVTFTSITGFNDLDLENVVDNDYSAAPISLQRAATDQQEFSQEFRFSGSSDHLNWLIGVFYYDLSIDTVDDSRFLDPAVDTFFSPPAGALAVLGVGSTLLRNDETTENLALFGEIELALSAAWSVSLSGRFAIEEKTLETFVSNPHTGIVLADLTLDDDWDSFTPKMTLDYRIDNNKLIYTSVSKAIKAGGFNALVNVTDAERRYDQEESINYEIGAKTTWADGRLTINAAAFLIDWTDQIVRALGQSNAILNSNAGATTSKGAELELWARLSEHLSLRLGYAYTDAKYDEYIFAALARLGLDPDVSGVALQNVSKNQGSLTLQYRRPISANWNWSLRTDSSFRTEQCTLQSCNAVVGDSSITNIRTGFENDNWALTLWVRNVFDDDTPDSGVFLQNRVRAVEVLDGAGIQFFNALVTSTEPRTLGATARYRF